MLGRNLFTGIASIVIFISASAGTASAATIPSFPLCANPEGQVKSSHETGTHGVPGDSTSYSGRDTVYTLSENTLTQCLCPINGNGVQTNWWKVSDLSQAEIDVLVNEGWIFIPNGLAWGLDNAPYLAKNSTFSCNSSGTGGSSGTNSQGGTGGGSILATSTQSVLSLASTGNKPFVYAVFLAGSALLASGLALTLKKRG